MYDLTVETVHTFAVGEGGWVVHNCSDELIDLSQADRRAHILDGDATGGGHRAGSGFGKNEFPPDWSDNQIMDAVPDIATDPTLRWLTQPNGNIRVEGTRHGVDIRVILNPRRNFDIWTAHPR
jgi:hypothetical protein